MYFYFDREGKRIDADTHLKLQNDPSYRLVREYDDGRICVRLLWTGRLTQIQKSSFSDTWPLFQIVAGNYDSMGHLTRDPNFDAETFCAESQAIKAYEEFLETWTESYRKDDGKFVEVDNTLAPPPPPDPDVPESAVKGMASDFTPW